MRTNVFAMCALTAALSVATVREARADWLLTPYLGVTFGGSAPEQQVNYGLSAAFLGAGTIGFELDASITPNFFDSDTGLLDDSNVSTVMANFMIAAPGTGATLRPYAAIGAGIIRTKATSVGNLFDIDENSFGVNIGGGLLAQFNDRIGMRGDVRYFRSVQDTDDTGDVDLDLSGFNFWRGTLGVTFRFLTTDTTGDTMKTLADAFHHTLQDVYFAEHALLKALPKVVSAVSSKELKAALKGHLAETKDQIKMLERVFTSIGEKASGEKCDAIAGLIKECEGVIADASGKVARNAAVIGCCQAIEHYEIARYGTLREWATALGHDEAHELLTKILDQEKKANHSLTHLAVTSINQA